MFHDPLQCSTPSIIFQSHLLSLLAVGLVNNLRSSRSAVQKILEIIPHPVHVTNPPSTGQENLLDLGYRLDNVVSLQARSHKPSSLNPRKIVSFQSPRKSKN